MKKTNLRILCLILALCLGLCACRDNAGGQETTGTPTVDPQQDVTYTVIVKDGAGNPLEGVGVRILDSANQDAFVWFNRTDADGKMTFTCKAGISCVAVLSDLAEGYSAEEKYPLTGPETTLVVSGAPVGEAAWKLGSTMPDFTITDCEGNTYTLSELLKEKDAVVLNFWYIQCAPCKLEFPYLQEAYEQYGDRIALLAVNPVNQDNGEIAKYKAENGLTFPMAAVPPEWEQLMGITGYPTTVIIDRNGVISLIHRGGIEDTKTIADAMDYFASEDYVPGVIEDIKDLARPDEIVHLGTKDDPLQFPGQLSFELTIPAGQETYFQLSKILGMYMQVKDGDVSVIYKDKEYAAKNGQVAMMVSCPDTFTPITIGVRNPTDKDKVVKVTLSFPSGTANNPYTLKDGKTTVKLSSGNDQGVCYRYTAKEDGELTVSCLGITPKVDYDIVLFNTSTNAQRNLEADGSKDENGNPCVTVKIKKGQQVMVTVMTLPDSSRNYPAASIQLNTTFKSGAVDEEKPEVKMVNYAITATDADRKPLSGVIFQINTGSETHRVTTAANGIARIQLPAGTYEVTMVIPEGYKAGTTKFTLSEAIPMFAVKLDEDVVVTENYTVKLQDENGSPISGVTVLLGSGTSTTGADGTVSFTLPKAQYTAQIVVPDGYESDVTAFPFGKNQTSLTITLKTASSGPVDPPDDGKISYKVTVTDYAGKPVTGVSVVVKKDSVPVYVGAVNASGVVSCKLEPGTYTVSLASATGTELHYIAPAPMTETAPETTVKVASLLTSAPEDCYFDNTTYPVDLGGTFVKTQVDIDNFFIFEAPSSGLYRLSVSDPNAKISYWGSSTSFVREQPGYASGAGYVELNIKDNMSPTVILAIKGTEGCILEITRLGDWIPDESDIPYEEFKGEYTPEMPGDGSDPPRIQVPVPSGKQIVSIDLTSGTEDIVLVADANGIIHLGSAAGPIVYMNLGPTGAPISLSEMLGIGASTGTGFSNIFRDENGAVTKKEEYTACLKAYVLSADEQNGLYPMNTDLMYMMIHGGEGKGWWDPENGNFQFADFEGINLEIAWMFLCCVIE